MVLYNGTKGFVWLIIWHRSYNNLKNMLGKDKTQYNGFLTNTNLRYFVYTYGTNLHRSLPTHRHDHLGLRWLHTRKLHYFLPCHIHNILCFHIGMGRNMNYRLWFYNLNISLNLLYWINFFSLNRWWKIESYIKLYPPLTVSSFENVLFK